MEEFVSRRLSIGDRKIVVLDNVFPADAVKTLHGFLGRLPYQLSEVDTNETLHNRNWAANLPVAMAAGMPILGRCVELAREFHAGPLDLVRAYVNFNRYGDMQYNHQDGPAGVTVLYYANAKWEDHWGGETVFCSDEGEPLHLVIPKPGRVVLFHPHILHRGGVPSRDCWEARMAVALKLVPST
jgi:hypothetical protein